MRVRAQRRTSRSEWRGSHCRSSVGRRGWRLCIPTGRSGAYHTRIQTEVSGRVPDAHRALFCPGWRTVWVAPLDGQRFRLGRLPRGFQSRPVIDCGEHEIRVGVELGLTVIDLRFVCSSPADFANPIEPSSCGGAKMARVIVNTLSIPAQNNVARVVIS